MKKLLSIFSLFIFISGCSSKTESFTVICETDMFFDESLTFDLETNTVNVKNTLNKYGYQSKKALESAGPSAVGDEQTQDMMSIFEESERTMYIRSFDDGLIVYAQFLEPEDLDIQSTFNRATLKVKTVTKYSGELLKLLKDDSFESEKISYAECIKPAV